MEQERILRLSPEDLLNPERLEAIYESPDSYYWSDDWSPGFYRILTQAGFLPVSFNHPDLGQILIPQMHANFAVLDWEDRRPERSMERWRRSERFAEQNYRLDMDHDLEEILRGIQAVHGEDNWLQGRYVELLRKLTSDERQSHCRIRAVGLLARQDELIAGELGYEVGAVYTSLSGFFHRGNRLDNHAGKLQLHLLAAELEERGFVFWNLGQPEMEYKFKLGAKKVPRAEFLTRWPRFRP